MFTCLSELQENVTLNAMFEANPSQTLYATLQSKLLIVRPYKIVRLHTFPFSRAFRGQTFNFIFYSYIFTNWLPLHVSL